MTKKERVLAAVKGEQPDRVPSGFWLHFPPAMHHGEAAVKAHLEFFEQTETDILKVMNENLFPTDSELTTAEDWKRVRPINLSDRFVVDQLDIIKSISDQIGDQAVLLTTIHGTVASAFHTALGRDDYEIRRETLATHLREKPEIVGNAFRIIAEGLAALTEASLEAGAQGIYYAALGGERVLFTDEEFETYVKPNDLAVLDAAKDASAFNVLHICKDNVNFDRYKDYPAEVVNWAIFENGVTLSQGRSLFPDSVLLGGLDDRSGVIVEGSQEEIEEAVFNLLDEVGTRRFILGSDCTLPTEISYSRIREAVLATEKYKERL